MRDDLKKVVGGGRPQSHSSEKEKKSDVLVIKQCSCLKNKYAFGHAAGQHTNIKCVYTQVLAS